MHRHPKNATIVPSKIVAQLMLLSIAASYGGTGGLVGETEQDNNTLSQMRKDLARLIEQMRQAAEERRWLSKKMTDIGVKVEKMYTILFEGNGHLPLTTRVALIEKGQGSEAALASKIEKVDDRQWRIAGEIIKAIGTLVIGVAVGWAVSKLTGKP
jgi:hypothetical protein